MLNDRFPVLIRYLADEDSTWMDLCGKKYSEDKVTDIFLRWYQKIMNQYNGADLQ